MKNWQWPVLAVALTLGCGDNYPSSIQFGIGSGGSAGTITDASAAVSGTGGAGGANQPSSDAATDVSISIIPGDPEHCGPGNLNCTREGMVTACLNNLCIGFECVSGYRAIGNNLVNGCEPILNADANVVANDAASDLAPVLLDTAPPVTADAASSDSVVAPILDTAAIDILTIDASSVQTDSAIDVSLPNPDGITPPSIDGGVACQTEGQVNPDIDSSYCFDAVKGDGRVTCVNHVLQCVYSQPVNPRSCAGARPNEFDTSSWCRINANCPYGIFFCNGQTVLWECTPIFGANILPECFSQDAGTDSSVIVGTIDSGIDSGNDVQQQKIDTSIDIGSPDALPAVDLPPPAPDVPPLDTGVPETVPLPVVDCLAVEGNPSVVTVTFSGYADRSLNAAVFDNLATASGKKQYCVVGDFNGWSGRLNCQDWVADPKVLVFPNIPVRVPQSNSRINLTLDLGNNTEQWVDDTRVVVKAGSLCANLPGLNIVVN